MKRKIVTYSVDLVLLLCFIIVGSLGIIIFPGVLQLFGFTPADIPKAQLYFWHSWIGLLMLVILSFHVDLHWRWLVRMTKRLFGRLNNGTSLSHKRRIDIGVDVILLMSFLVVFITGILKFPGLLPFLQINPLSIPLNLLSLLHDWSGVIVVVFSIVHLFLHMRWMVATTKFFGQKIKASPEKSQQVVVALIAIAFASVMTINAFGLPFVSEDAGGGFFGRADNTLSIESIGDFRYNPSNVTRMRPDIFSEGAISLFDIVVYLHWRGYIDLEYHFDETMNTHVIDSINGKTGWWYQAWYDGGWPERSVFRMDHYPYKDKMTIKLFQMNQNEIDAIYQQYREEIDRKHQYEGEHIIPTVIIQGTERTLRFPSVVVTAHNLRTDLFQPGTITAIDVILSLGDQKKLTYDLQWYESIGRAEVVRSYFIDVINEDQSVGRCGFVYEEGSLEYLGFRGNHIHIPSDARVLNAPEYIEWFWICI